MSAPAAVLSDLFPLGHMGAILRDFAPPPGRFDPRGAWTSRYRVFSLTGSTDPAAELTLRRLPGQSGTFNLLVDYTHPLPPAVFRRRFRAEMLCREDALATPLSWKSTGWAEDRDGAEQPHSRWTREGRFRDGEVRIADARGERKHGVSGALAANWALFEAVQRLPREPFENTPFSLLDDFCRVKPEQTLCFRDQPNVVAGGELVQRERTEQLEKGRIKRVVWARENAQHLSLTVYDHVGRGVLPWTYWVDSDDRLLLAVSGIEGYVLADVQQNEDAPQ